MNANMIDSPMGRTSSCSSFASFMSGLLQEYEVPFKDMKVEIVDDNAKNSDSFNGSQRSLVVMQRRKSIDRWSNELEKVEVKQFASVRGSSSCHSLSSATSIGASNQQTPQEQQPELRSSSSDDALLRLPQRSHSPRLVAKTRTLSNGEGNASKFTNASWDDVKFKKPQHNGCLDLLMVVDNPLTNCPPNGSSQRPTRSRTDKERPADNILDSDHDDIFDDDEIEEIPLKEADPGRPTDAARTTKRRSYRRNSSSSIFLQTSTAGRGLAGRGLPRQHSATFPAMEAAAGCMGLKKPQRRSSLTTASSTDISPQLLSPMTPPQFLKTQRDVEQGHHSNLSANLNPIDTNPFSSATAASASNLRNKAAALGINLSQSKSTTGKKQQTKATGGLSRAASSVVSLRESRKKASLSSKSEKKRFINDPSVLGLDVKLSSRLS